MTLDDRRLEDILREVKDVNKTVTQIRLDAVELKTANEEQHNQMNQELSKLTKRVGEQNGRVSKLEEFKTAITTKLKTIPATISFVLTTLGLIVGWVVLR